MTPYEKAEKAIRDHRTYWSGDKYLYLDIPGLTKLPEEIGTLEGLEILSLEGCSIEELPQDILKLKALTRLDLSGNPLQEIPPEVLDLKQLKVLSVQGCPLKKDSRFIQRLLAEYLQSHFTDEYEKNTKQVSKTLPSELLDYIEVMYHLTPFNGEDVDSVDLSQEGLDYLPEEIGNYPKLITLELFENGLKSLPESFTQLVNLEKLDLGENEFEKVPSYWNQFPKLKWLSFHANELTKWPQNLPLGLTYLDVSYNPITEIPSEIDKLQSLETLNLEGMGLERIPKELWELKNLKRLVLDGNHLSEVPPEISILENLEILNVVKMPFKTFSEALKKLPKLKLIFTSVCPEDCPEEWDVDYDDWNRRYVLKRN